MNASKITQARQDLREVYLLAFDNNATTPSEVADTFDGINIRYARELLGVLTKAGLLVVDENTDGVEGWQTLFSVDNDKRAKVVKHIDEWLEANVNDPDTATPAGKAEKPKREVKPKAEPHPCRCGCGDLVPGSSWYRPGHDARHAGVVGRQAAIDIENTTAGDGHLSVQADDADRFEDLPSEALRTKAIGIAEKALAKANDKRIKAKVKSAKESVAADADPAVVDAGDDGTEAKEDGTVKVGKHEYAAVRYTATGEVEYFDGADTKKASKTASKTFQVA